MKPGREGDSKKQTRNSPLPPQPLLDQKKTSKQFIYGSRKRYERRRGRRKRGTT
jgi:hypothetical protein